VHSLRLYEILKAAYDKRAAVDRSVKRGDTLDFTFHLLELKFRLSILEDKGNQSIRDELDKDEPDYAKIQEFVTKTGQTSYSEYKVFNRDVLAKSLKEINSKMSYHIDYQPLKKGRSTEKIRFFVTPLKDVLKRNVIEAPEDVIELTQEDKDNIINEVYDSLRKNFRVTDVMKFCELADYDVVRIFEAYECFKSATNVENPVGYMISAIKGGWKPTNSKPEKDSFQQNSYDYDELEKKLLRN
jgi:plasmid replication initiation protein